jgi:phosphoribosylglycinamide formyltransferase-1
MSRAENGSKPRILVFASGDKDGGGSGFQEMVEYTKTSPPVLNADIVAVVSNHQYGGVCKKAKKLGIPFTWWDDNFNASGYQGFVKIAQSNFVMLSGWLKLVTGLDPATTINIHPGPLPAYGGPGMYGHFVHEAVIKDFKAGKITQSAVTMHFVDEEYDRGPIIHQAPVLIRDDDTPKTIAERVNEVERVLQSRVLNRVVNDDIFYHDGKVFYKDSNLKNEWYL